MGLMILFSAVVFTTLSSDFCLAWAVLDPNPSSDWQELSVQRMKESSTNRGGRLSSGLFLPQSQAEGSVLSSQSWETSRGELGSRLQAEERKIYHELITIGHLSSASYKTPV